MSNVIDFKDKSEKEIEQEKEITAFNNEADLKKKVTRGEVVDIMKQIIDNINQTNQYLMEDVNVMYAQQVFPFQMEVYAIEQLLVEKGIFTKEEIEVKIDEHKKELLERARTIKESEDGGVELATEEEDKVIEGEKVLKALNSKEKES